MGGSIAPPWHSKNRLLHLQQANRMLRKKRGKAPLPQSKAAQRAIAASLADRPATKIEAGRRAVD